MRYLLVVLFSLSAVAQTVSLSGSLKYPDGTGVNGTLYLALSQVAALSLNSPCGGPIEVVPTYQVPIKVVNGVMQSPPSIYGNDCLVPQGTFYNAKLIDSNANVIFNDRWYLAGSSVDVGSIVSMVISGTQASLGTPGVAFTLPIVSQTITQPPGTQFNVNFLTVTSTLTAPNGASCTTSACNGFNSPNVLLSTGNYTITGQWTFAQSILGGPFIDIGSDFNSFNDGYFDGHVIAGGVRVVTGNIAAPDGYFTLESLGPGALDIIDSNNATLLQFSAGPPAWFFAGGVWPLVNASYNLGNNNRAWNNAYLSGSIQMTGTNGADLDCSTVSANYVGINIRVDTHQIQSCIGGNLYTAQLQ